MTLEQLAPDTSPERSRLLPCRRPLLRAGAAPDIAARSTQAVSRSGHGI